MMDDRLHKALAAIDPTLTAHCAARWHRMDAAERGAVWADRLREGGR